MAAIRQTTWVLFTCLVLVLCQPEAGNNEVSAGQHQNCQSMEEKLDLCASGVQQIKNCMISHSAPEAMDQLVDEMRKGFLSVKKELTLERSRPQLLEEKIHKFISGVQQAEVVQATERRGFHLQLRQYLQL